MLFKSNGKILLSSEYLVMDGAKSIALPTKSTQDLFVSEYDKEAIIWQSFDMNDNLWYEERFFIKNNNLTNDGKKNIISEKIKLLFNHITKINDIHNILGNKFVTKLNFKREWGLGTSSTFVNNLAKWAKVDPYKLLFSAFKGSGYDIACCDVNNPIIYSKIKNSVSVKNIKFNQKFIDNIYLVYLEKKQNTESSIKNYLKIKSDKNNSIKQINLITNEMIECKDLNLFEDLIEEHESIISKVISLEPIHKSTFSDYNKGKIKSLGSWGGDFILVTSKDNDLSYFKKKGYRTIFRLSDMVYTG